MVGKAMRLEEEELQAWETLGWQTEVSKRQTAKHGAGKNEMGCPGRMSGPSLQVLQECLWDRPRPPPASASSLSKGMTIPVKVHCQRSKGIQKGQLALSPEKQELC